MIFGLKTIVKCLLYRVYTNFYQTLGGVSSDLQDNLLIDKNYNIFAVESKSIIVLIFAFRQLVVAQRKSQVNEKNYCLKLYNVSQSRMGA